MSQPVLWPLQLSSPTTWIVICVEVSVALKWELWVHNSYLSCGPKDVCRRAYVFLERFVRAKSLVEREMDQKWEQSLRVYDPNHHLLISRFVSSMYIGRSVIKDRWWLLNVHLDFYVVMKSIKNSEDVFWSCLSHVKICRACWSPEFWSHRNLFFTAEVTPRIEIQYAKMKWILGFSVGRIQKSQIKAC